MKLDRVILACNENEEYLAFWPIVKPVWTERIGVPVVLYYVGESLPEHLKDDPDVRLWPPIPGWPTATQAQCIRLLVSAIQDCSGAVLVGDIDCMPLHPEFFHDTMNDAREDQFVSYKAPIETLKEICMCYVAAAPRTWGDLFEIRSEADIRKQMMVWASANPADGEKNGLGWTTDQKELYKRVKAFDPERIHIQNWRYEYPRLCRSMPFEWNELNDFLATRLHENYYIDFHMPPLRPFFAQITGIREFVLELARERREGLTPH
jgi:hypothetical protein